MKTAKPGIFSNIETRIFVPAVLILVVLGVLFAFYEKNSLALLNAAFTGIVNNFGWGYIWYTVLVTGTGLFMAFSRYGRVVLGAPDEKPQFTLFQYASILVAMGLGSTIMRTGSMEWANVALNPPFGLEARSAEAIITGNAYGMYLWSSQTFSIFVMSAPVMAYLLHVRKRPIMRISEAFRCLVGDKAVDGIFGRVIDVFFLISIVAGASVTLGLGAPIVTNILTKMFDTQLSFGLTMAVTMVWVVILVVAACFGLEKGIKTLGVFNMYLAAAVAAFILIAGPGAFILNNFTDCLGSLFTNYVDFTFNADSLRSEEAGYVQRYTVFWFAYNATWSLLHSIFAAKVSRGRTIREMILTYYLAPMFLSWLATGILGGMSIQREVAGLVPVLDIVSSSGMMAAIPEVLASMPFSTILMLAFILLASIFMITTMNSAAYTIATYTSREDMSRVEPSKFVHVVVSVIISAIAVVLMEVGGLVPLEVTSGLMGLPIIFIQIATVYAGIKMMNQDKAWIHNVRKVKCETLEAPGSAGTAGTAAAADA